MALFAAYTSACYNYLFDLFSHCVSKLIFAIASGICIMTVCGKTSAVK